MAGFMGNDGTMYYFEDVNNCGNRIYWMTSEGTLFDSDELIEKAKAITPNPTITYSDFYAERYVTADSVLQGAQNQWLWIVGDPYITGLACYYDSANDRLVLCRYAYDSNFYEKNIPNETFIPHGVRFYIVYHQYDGGVLNNLYGAIMYSNTDKVFNINYQIINPLNIHQAITINRNVVRLAVGESVPLVTLEPDTICAYSGNLDGSGLSITVGGIEYGIYRQAWINGADASKYTQNGFMGFLEENEVIPSNKSNPSNPSTTGGGDGEVRTSVPIPVPELPPDMLLASGVVKMYVPSVNELNAFMHYIYSAPDNIIANFKKIWANPMQSIISFSIVPFVLTTDGSETVKFCGIDSGVSMGKLASQFMKVSCGKLDSKIEPLQKLKEENCSFLDYSPNTKVSIYLPFIGINSLNVDDCMNATISVDYNIDLLTGDCTAFVSCTKQVSEYKIDYDSVLYTFKGNILAQSPLAGNDYQQLYNGILNIAGLSAGMVASGGVNAGGVLGIAHEVMSPKVSVHRSGAVVGNTGHLSGYTPYLIIECPVSSIPTAYDRLIGNTSNIYMGMKALKNTGYTEIEKDSIKVVNVKCTDNEKEMIKNYLESGVIF